MASDAPCNYDGYHYRSEFWEKANRSYENQIEKATVSYLLGKLPDRAYSLLDAGCGFARLYESYVPFSDKVTLLDFSQEILDDIPRHIKEKGSVTVRKGDIMKMPFDDASHNVVLSIRTLHHLDDPTAFFREAYRVLTPGGYLLFEIPNKRHLINIIRYLSGRLKISPFSPEKLTLNTHFYNYHPSDLIQRMESSGFSLIQMRDTSFFRHAIFKRLLSDRALIALESLMQRCLGWTHLTPSIFCLASKS